MSDVISLLLIRFKCLQEQSLFDMIVLEALDAFFKEHSQLLYLDFVHGSSSVVRSISNHKIYA